MFLVKKSNFCSNSFTLNKIFKSSLLYFIVHKTLQNTPCHENAKFKVKQFWASRVLLCTINPNWTHSRIKTVKILYYIVYFFIQFWVCLHANGIYFLCLKNWNLGLFEAFWVNLPLYTNSWEHTKKVIIPNDWHIFTQWLILYKSMS